MNNWLVKLAQEQPTSEDNLRTALEGLPPEAIREMALDMGSASVTEHQDSFNERITQADAMGREMAHIHGDELEKNALLGAFVGAASRAIGPVTKALNVGSTAKTIKDGATQGIQQMKLAHAELVKQARYEFAKEAIVSGLVRKAARTAWKDPTKALAVGGAAVGAAQGLVRDPGYDENGNRRSRLGAAAKGAIGGGAIGYGVGKFVPGAGAATSAAGRSVLRTNAASNIAKAKATTNPNLVKKNLIPKTPAAAQVAQVAPAQVAPARAAPAQAGSSQERLFKKTAGLLKLAWLRKQALFTMGNPITTAQKFTRGIGAGTKPLKLKASPPPITAAMERAGRTKAYNKSVSDSLNNAVSLVPKKTAQSPFAAPYKPSGPGLSTFQSRLSPS